jgi:thymidylate synthase (methanogen type)
MEIIAQCIAEAHERTVDTIIDEGILTSIETEPGKWMNTWEHPDPIMVIVRHPERKPDVSKACDFGEKFIEQYEKDILTVQDRGFVYEYPNRLFDHPIIEMYDPDDLPQTLLPRKQWGVYGNGNGKGIDQIAQIVEKLTNNPTNRRSLAITWVPELDGDAVEPPCLQFTHFLMRKGVVAHGQDPEIWYLSGRFPFRSHDMLSGDPMNKLGLRGLMKFVASRVSRNINAQVRVGSLITWSSSAHIYCDAQAKELTNMTNLINKKKTYTRMTGRIYSANPAGWWVKV